MQGIEESYPAPQTRPTAAAMRPAIRSAKPRACSTAAASASSSDTMACWTERGGKGDRQEGQLFGINVRLSRTALQGIDIILPLLQ